MNIDQMQAKLGEYLQIEGLARPGDAEAVARFIDFCKKDRRCSHTVLFVDGERALLHCPALAPRPFVIACGYDETTGERSHESRYADVSRAWDAFDPAILEDATVKWRREDFEAAFEAHDAEPSAEAVDEAIEAALLHRGWMDVAISHGNECIDEAVRDVIARAAAAESD